MNRNTFLHKSHSLSVVYWLIGINSFLFISARILPFLFQINTTDFYNQLQLSEQFSILIERPWTLITYAFFHTDFSHLLFNMLLLYFGGILFLNLFSPKRLLLLYFIGIIFGGVTFISAYKIFPAFSNHISSLLGASAGIMALLIFMSTYTPLYKIRLFSFLNFPLWTLGVGLILLDMISIPISNSGGRFAHLGGALGGFLYAYILKKKQRVGGRSLKNSRKSKKKSVSTSLTEEEKKIQEQVNIILDKISKSGYESLSNDEKTFLFKVSKSMK